MQLSDDSGHILPYQVGKIVCIGRNYLDHIHELGNEVTEQALFFMKPASCLQNVHQPIVIPAHMGECHNELELAVLIKDPLHNATEAQALDAVWGYGLGLDLTLREVQATLKAKGHPWERAKAFAGACPLSQFVDKARFAKGLPNGFTLTVNGELRQVGETKMMMRSLSSLLAEISSLFTLQPGDVVLTGTPQGVGPLHSGDRLTLTLDDVLQIDTEVS